MSKVFQSVMTLEEILLDKSKPVIFDEYPAEEPLSFRNFKKYESLKDWVFIMADNGVILSFSTI